MDNAIWTMPAETLKGLKGANQDFRVPLSTEAMSVVSKAMEQSKGNLLFSISGRAPISDVTMSKWMKEQGIAARPHGFRSTLRTWSEDQRIPYEVAETTLGHAIGSKVERAYQRSDLIEQRREQLQSYSDYLTG